MSYKEIIDSILRTLKTIDSGEANEVTATSWRHLYLRDVTFLIKQLAEKNKDKKDLVQELKDRQSIVEAGLTNIDKIVQDLKKNMGS